jgi:molybdate transport system substrate-binding protein
MNIALKILTAAFLVILSACAMTPASDTSNRPEVQVVNLYAAGSLRTPLTQIARAFEASQQGVKVGLQFGASGLLKDRIVAQSDAADSAAHVFASANMEHPQALVVTGRFALAQAFTRNALCALAAPGIAVTSENLVATLLNPALKLGISTPKADPSGDYAWAMFERIETAGAAPRGSADQLKAKALQLTGGPNSPPPPTDRNVYGVLASNGQADVFITYCTNAAIARAEVPALHIVQIAAAYNVSAEYGVTVLKSATPTAHALAKFLQSDVAQKILISAGFSKVSP